MRSPDNNLPGTNMQSYWFQTISENAQVCCVMVFSPPFLLTEVNVRKEHQVKWSNVKISEDCNLHHACVLHKSRMHLHILVSLPCTPRAVYRARQCVVLQGSTSGDSCSLRSWEPKPLFGSRPACFLLHLLRPWGSSHSGSCPRKWHCRNLDQTSPKPTASETFFTSCTLEGYQPALSSSIVLLYLTSIPLRIKGS